MNWFFIALGAPFLWAFVNISDQYLVAKYQTGKRSSGGLVLFSSLIGLFVAGLILIFTKGIFNISLLDKGLLLLSGVITSIWIIFYLFALEIESVSTVVSWFLAIPIFGYVLGYIFLGETLSKGQWLGSLIILLGVSLISIDFREQKKTIKWLPAFYMLLSCFLIASIGVIFKYVTVGADFWVSSYWEYLGLGISGILMFLFVPKYRREFILMNKNGGRRIFTLNILSETTTIIGNLLTNYAILLAPVAMVYLVSSFQPAILLFLTLLSTKFFPQIVREDLSKRALAPKVIAIIIITLGSIILFI